MIEPAHDLPVSRQAELLDLSRSNVYYLPRPASESDLRLMRRIDELHLNYPFAGARMLRTCSSWKALRWVASTFAR
jgi:putative transposase